MRALLTLALVALGACADAPPEPPTLRVRGVYLQPMFQGEAMEVDHEAIPGRMPAMRMPFRVADPSVLDGLPEGAAVRLTLDSASLRVLDVETLPAGTPLDLEPTAGGGAVIVPDDE